MIRFLLTWALAGVVLGGHAQEHDTGHAWFDEARFGMFIHFGTFSTLCDGEWVMYDQNIDVSDYHKLQDIFNPSLFNASEWVAAAKSAGMKYIIFTSRHHDGFAIWFSDYSEYDMENTPAKRDLMAEMKEACDRHGIMFGAYYSNLDWYHPDWAPYSHGGPGPLFPKQEDSPNLTRYFEYMANQVCELIDKYDLAFIQFDGEWDATYTHEVGSAMYRHFHTRKPDILIQQIS